MVAVSGVAILALIAAGNRNPLMFVALAGAIRFLKDVRVSGRPALRLGAVLLIGYAALVVMVSLSAWRGDIRDGTNTSLIGTVESTAGDPFSRLSAAGLDSFDGLVLSQRVDRRAAGVSRLYPLMIVGGFVPHQLWPAKPNWLSPQVTHVYANFPGASGIFLSGPAFGYILYGGIPGSILIYALLGALSAAAYRRLRAESFFFVLFSYFLFTFVLIGDSYTAFYALAVCLTYGGAVLATKALAAFAPRKAANPNSVDGRNLDGKVGNAW